MTVYYTIKSLGCKVTSTDLQKEWAVNNKAVTRVWVSSEEEAESDCDCWSVDQREENRHNRTR